MISIPAQIVFDGARQSQIFVIAFVGFSLLFAIILINIFLRFTITNPLKNMALLAKKVSTGDMSIEFQHNSNDEIGGLAASLNRMKISLQIAMNMIESESDN